jgi:DNA-binding XRE family transcriptional regulator
MLQIAYRGERHLQAKSRIYAAFYSRAVLQTYGVPTRKIFGQNVSRLRAEAGLTQEQLCELAEIDRSYLQRIEKGTSEPTVSVALRLRLALKCSWDDLFRGCE